MTAAEARRGGKPGDLDPPMEFLKANWLREVDEIVGDVGEGLSPQEERPDEPMQLQPQAQPIVKAEGRAPPTPTTPSTRSMAIDSIVDKVDAS